MRSKWIASTGDLLKEICEDGDGDDIDKPVDEMIECANFTKHEFQESLNKELLEASIWHKPDAII